MDSRIQGNCEAEETLGNEKKHRNILGLKKQAHKQTSQVSVICTFLEKSHSAKSHFSK